MKGAHAVTDVDNWLARLPAEQRTALEKLRAQIRAAAPGAEETISYGLPTFELHGHLVAFGAFKKHLSFFPMTSPILAKFPEAEPFIVSAGTMRFHPDKLMPAALVKKIVKARILENLEVAAERAAAKRKTAAPGKKK
jgi:uncharacterized protein YdhG (YjbR/CyaY superfamily)